jgi:hypothetical protein
MLVTEGPAIEDVDFDFCYFSSILLCLELESIMTGGSQRGFNTSKHGIKVNNIYKFRSYFAEDTPHRVGFKVLTAVSMKRISWDVAL